MLVVKKYILCWSDKACCVHLFISAFTCGLVRMSSCCLLAPNNRNEWLCGWLVVSGMPTRIYISPFNILPRKTSFGLIIILIHVDTYTDSFSLPLTSPLFRNPAGKQEVELSLRTCSLNNEQSKKKYILIRFISARKSVEWKVSIRKIIFTGSSLFLYRTWFI